MRSYNIYLNKRLTEYDVTIQALTYKEALEAENAIVLDDEVGIELETFVYTEISPVLEETVRYTDSKADVVVCRYRLVSEVDDFTMASIDDSPLFDLDYVIVG